MATRMLTDLSERPKPFEVTGDAHQVSLNWTAWLEEFEAYADSIGLFIAEDADENKQQRRAMLLYVKKFVPREGKWEDEAQELIESGEMAPESQAKQ
jgi:hypothetical protein